MALLKLESLEWFWWDDLVGKFVKIPHTKPVERKIVYEFINKGYLKGYYAFDVRLPPEDRPLMPGETPFDYEVWKALHSLRIDFIVKMPSELWVCEVKDLLRASALGEVELYASLFPKKYECPLPIRKAVIVGTSKPELEPAFLEKNIKIFNLEIESSPKRIFM